MEVNGIGGVFIRAKDPEALTAWYRKHLGITHYSEKVWVQKAGPTVVNFFPMAGKDAPESSEYFPAEQSVMLNFRVDDLDAMLKELEASGIPVLTDPSWNSPEVGRFARIFDPERNAIELWEPASGD